ncbi:helix-turn-helix domain-containing protein [Saccharibacillus sp. JS10]|uniref:helix-turn-helix domain-containing protein n=1 Tax=Saccharibacillus sp. JS10 TaxID=2950552 RepID=UPI002108B1E7|nr:helix-turn-helix transcriptional regulator [Saccharibacillus sp. JS10]MCQ4088495.1 helix-turn-helix domain-containing protein [Saccharibacillus sp. JS10]
MGLKVKIGQRIKTLRNYNKITQEDLALRTGLDRTYINSVENGRRNISIETLEKIAKGFNMNIFNFFNNDSFKGE